MKLGAIELDDKSKPSDAKILKFFKIPSSQLNRHLIQRGKLPHRDQQHILKKYHSLFTSLHKCRCGHTALGVLSIQ